MAGMFDSVAYMPHGYCLFWQPGLLALHAGADLLIFLSYSAIPLALILFLNRRPDIRFGWIVSLFAAFIMLCGFTHAIAIATLWEPIYRMEGLVKLLTGVVSATTAISLFALMPKLVAIPSPQQLEAVHAKLVAAIEAHRVTLEQLGATERAIERRIEQRTAELEAANSQLEILSREAVHRSANLAAVILSLARETARRAPDLASFMQHFAARVSAIATATASLISDERGSFSRLETVLHDQLAPMTETFGERILVRGPEVEVGAKGAQQLALAMHELATNAVKYGALSTPGGTVVVEWTIAPDGDALQFSWRESGAPPPPAGGVEGFGTKLLKVAIPETLGGRASRVMTDEGLHYELWLPLQRQPAGAPVQDAPGEPPPLLAAE